MKISKTKAIAILETREKQIIKAMIKSCWTKEDVRTFVSAANEIDESRDWVYSMLEKQSKKIDRGDMDRHFD